MKKYRVIFSAIQCNKFTNKLMKACDVLGKDDAIGVKVEISYVTTTEPTDEYLENIKSVLELTECYSEIDFYYSNVEFKRIEILDNGEVE